MVCPDLSSCCFTEIDVPIYLRWVSQASLDCCKGCQATCCIWCGMRDGYVFNEGEMCLIFCLIGVHQSILHSWGDISVLLVSWQCSWGFSSVPSGKSRFLTYVFDLEHGTPQHEMQGNRASSCSEREVSWVFSSFGRHLVFILELRGDGHLKFWFIQRRQDSCLVMTDTSGS